MGAGRRCLKAIFCVRGGYGVSEVADRLSLDLVKRAGKLIIGYSDITVLHSAWSSVGLPSIHACMSGAFADDFPAACFEAERRMLAGEIPAYTCAGNDLNRVGKAAGTLVGGNLSTFTTTPGTAYNCMVSNEPLILFLEDVGEDIQHIHRYLTVLEHIGALGDVAGIVFGEWADVPTDMDDYPGDSRGGTFTSVADMISRQFLNHIDVPVAFGFPAGHADDANYPLLMGETAHLDVSADGFTLSWES